MVLNMAEVLFIIQTVIDMNEIFFIVIVMEEVFIILKTVKLIAVRLLTVNFITKMVNMKENLKKKISYHMDKDLLTMTIVENMLETIKMVLNMEKELNI